MIIKKIKGKIWKSLLFYIYGCCDEVIFTRRYNIWDEENNKLLKIVSSLVDINDDIYSIDYNILLSNDEINKVLVDEGVITDDEEYRKWYLCSRLENILEWIEYEKLISLFLDKYQLNLVEKKEYYFEEDYMKDSNIYQHKYKTIYIFKLNEEMKKEILKSKSIYEWMWPNNIEDICFIRNSKIWLYFISNRLLCEIYCKNEEEYEYLKSFGIQFEKSFYEDETISIDDLSRL